MKSVSRRNFLKSIAVTTAAAASTTLTSCKLFDKSPDIKPEGGKITLWCAGVIENFYNARAEEFLADYPEYEIEVVNLGAEINDKMQTSLVAGTGAPDIGTMGEGFITALFKGGVAERTIYDLNPLLYEIHPRFKEKFLKWGYYTDQNGRTYGIEMALSHCVYWYRKDLHDEAGLDPTTYITYADFVEGGKIFHEKHPDKYALFVDTGAADTFVPLLLQNGGGYFDRDGNVILDCEENIEALQLCYDMAYTHEMAWPNSDVWGPGMWAALKDGTASGDLGADWYGAAILKPQVPDQEGKWAATKMPLFREGGATTGCLGGMGYLIPKQTQHPEVAWEFLKYTLLTKEGQVKKFLEIQNFPTMLEAMKDPRITELEDPFFGGQKVGALLAEVAPGVPEFNAHPYLVEAYALTRGVVPVVMSGAKTPKEALSDAAQELREAMTKE